MINFFKKDVDKVVAPVSGRCIPLKDVKDEVFSSKAMGDGFAVIPDQNIVVSPVNGEIVLVADTKHAVGLRTKSGVEILVHIGLDTVELNGKGFISLLKAGQKVKAGDRIIQFDEKYLTDDSIDMTTMVVFTSGLKNVFNSNMLGTHVTSGDTVFTKM